MNKKIIKGIITLLLLVAFSTISTFAAETIFEGNGTNESPYLIQSSVDIENLAELVNSGNDAYISSFYKLTEDVSLDVINHTPIGTEEYPFSGSFDGGLHTIKDLQITSSEKYLGFFGVTKNAQLKNIIIENADIIASSKDILFAGILSGCMIVVGENNSFDVAKCSVQGNVNLTSNKTAYAAGLVAKCDVTNGLLSFSNCHTNVSVIAKATTIAFAGGIISNMSAASSGFVSVNNSVVEGYVSAESTNLHSYAGGVVAFANQQDSSWSDFVPLAQASNEAALMATTTVYNFNRCVVDCEVESTGARSVYISNLAAYATDYVTVGINYASTEKAVTASQNSISCNRSISRNTLLTKDYLANTVGLDFTNTWTIVFNKIKLRTSIPYILAELDEQENIVKAQPVGCSAGNLIVAIYSEKNRIDSVKIISCLADVQDMIEIPLGVSDYYAVKVFMIDLTSLSPLTEFVEF